MEHVFDNVCKELEYNADPIGFDKKLDGPKFIGQGCSRRVGSDCYAYYIVEKKQIGSKTVWGLSPAKTHFATSWTDGTEICDGPVSWKADRWIVARGKWKKSGRPKWWYCNADGKRCYGQHADLSFDGAYAYQNPSF